MLCKEKSIETMEQSSVTMENSWKLNGNYGKIDEHFA